MITHNDRQSRQRVACLRWLSPLLVIVAGCGTGVYPVEGKLAWPDGSPATELAGSQVVFEQQAANMSARGTVNADATFRLTTHQADDGAVPGEHKVIVLEVGRKSAGGVDSSQLAPGVLDPKFYNFDTSGLTAVVKPQTNEISLTVERNKTR